MIKQSFKTVKLRVPPDVNGAFHPFIHVTSLLACNFQGVVSRVRLPEKLSQLLGLGDDPFGLRSFFDSIFNCILCLVYATTLSFINSVRFQQKLSSLYHVAC